jgi:membrane dipeptidase
MTLPRPVPIFDGHNDVLLRLNRHPGADPVRSLLEGEGRGQLDLPMAQAGGFAGGLFAIFVPSPNFKPPANGDVTFQPQGADDTTPPPPHLTDAQAATFAMAALLLRIEKASGGRVRVCRGVGDIRDSMAAGALAPVLHIEGAEAIDENFEVLELLHAAGLRSLGPVWSRSNVFGHGVPFRFPASPDIGPGLTDLGKELIQACNRLNILIDLSHLNEKGFWDVAALSDAPLVATHSNAHAVSPHARNLTNKQLAAVRESGGMVGVNFAVSFLRPDGRQDTDTPIEQVIDHVDYLLQHLGEDGVGFGSDFDGTRVPAKMKNAAGLQALVQIMRVRGYGEALIEKICTGNWMRVLARTWGELPSA